MTPPRLTAIEEAAGAARLRVRKVEGGLIEYAPNQDQSIRQAAAYVDRILRGARPSELPIEQAAKFDLGINLRTARKLNVSIPPPLLLRADQVIE